jgi:hypothetical protein
MTPASNAQQAQAEQAEQAEQPESGLGRRLAQSDVVPSSSSAHSRASVDAALTNALAAIESARASGDRPAEAEALLRVGRARARRGDLLEAKRSFAAAMAIHRFTGQRSVDALGDLVLACLDAGDIDEASSHAEQVVALLEAGVPEIDGRARFAVALLDHVRGRFSQAKTRYADVSVRASANGNRTLEASAQLYSAFLLAATGALEGSNAAVARSKALLAASGDAQRLSVVHALEAVLAAAGGRCAAALVAWDVAKATPVDDELATRAIFAMTGAFLDGAAPPFLAIAQLARQGREPSVVCAARGAEVHVFAQMLDALTARRQTPRPAPETTDAAALVVNREDGTVHLPDGGTIDLSRRRGLLVVLVALAEQERLSPGTQNSADTLVERVWPGQSQHVEVGRNRVRVAIARLRKLGLDRWIVTDRDGYRLRRVTIDII